MSTIIQMNYTYEPKKLATNVEKHGVWFQVAESFEWETALVNAYTRKQYAETRFEAIGYVGDRLYVMVFCLRETYIRIISLRKANSREVRRYANT